MDTNRLRYFIVVNATESIRKAAEILHISPAALSKAIKQLELEIGTSLLTPSGRGIVITQAGRDLASQTKPLLDRLFQIKKDVKDQTKREAAKDKTIRIGSYEVFSTHFLTTLLDAIPERSDLFIYNLIPGEIETNLLEYKIDYGITYLPVPTIGIHHHQVARIEMKIFGRKKIFDELPFNKIPFVVSAHPLQGLPDKVQGLDAWPDGQIERFIKYRVTNMESALELCRKGKAVVYLPSFVINLHNKSVKPDYQLKPIPVPNNMRTKNQAVYLVKRKTDPRDPVFNKIAQVIRAVQNKHIEERMDSRDATP